jgi:nucleoid-associated protein YgaU
VLTAATALSFAPMAPVAMANEPAGIVPPGTESAGYVPVPAGFPTEAASGVGPADSTPATQYVVRPGDSFWRIAEATVAPDEEVATHWLRLVAANLERIRSGDPDLIFPGEIVVLPAKDAP